MILSQNLLSEFAKLTSNNNISKKETIIRGRVIKQNGNYLFNMLDTNSKIPVKIPSGLDLNYPVNAIIKNNSISVIGNVIDPETKLLLSYELKDKLVWTRPYYDNYVKFTSGNGKKYNSFNMFYKDSYAFKDKIIGNVDDFKINIKFSNIKRAIVTLILHRPILHAIGVWKFGTQVQVRRFDNDSRIINIWK